MKLWFIITPKGNPAFSIGGMACAAKTRKRCIWRWCWGSIYGDANDNGAWADWQRLGYRCERREVGG